MESIDASIGARVLCEHLKIFNLRSMEQISRQIRAIQDEADEPVEKIVSRMEKAWKDYQRDWPRMDWHHYTAIKFFESAIWDNPALWPYTRCTPRPDAGLGYHSGEGMPDAEVTRLRAKLNV